MSKTILRPLVSLFFLAAIATLFVPSDVMGQPRRRASRPPVANKPPATATNSPQLIVQLGHSGGINAAAFSPDGRLAVSGGDDPIAIIWEAATGRIIRRLVGHTSPVSAVAFSRDGRFILTGSGESEVTGEPTARPDNSARLWDAATGKELRRFVGHTARVTVVEFSPDGRLVLTASEDGKAGLWDAATGKILRIFIERDEATARVAKFSPDGRFVLTGGGDLDHTDYTLRLWDASTANVVQRFVGYEHPVGALAFSPDGQFVLCAGEKPLTEGLGGTEDLRMWDLKTGKEVRRFKALSPIAVSGDGKLMLTGGTALTPDAPATGPTLWDLNTGKKIREFNTVESTEKPKSDLTVKSDAKASQTDASEDDDSDRVGSIDSVAFSPDGLQVMIASNPLSTGGSGGFTVGSTNLTLYEVGSGKEVRRLAGIAETVSQVAFSRDNQFIIAGNVVWSLVTGQEIRFPDTKRDDRHKIEITSLSADGRLALTADSRDIAFWDAGYSSDDEEGATPRSNEIRLWDLSSAKQIARFPKAAEGWLSSDGRFVLTMENKEKPEQKNQSAADKQAERALGQDELRARLWETSGGKELWHYDFVPKGHSNAGGSYHGLTPSNFEWTISPDGRYVVIQGKDATVVLNTADGSIADKIADVGGDIPLLAVSPDSRYLASGSDDNDLGLISIKTGAVLWAQKDPAGTTFNSYSLSFSPNGRFLLVGGDLLREKAGQHFKSFDFKVLRLLDVATGRQLREFIDQSTSVYAFSSDSRFLLTVDTSANLVNMWNLATGQRAQQFAGHLAGVSSVAFSADQKLVLTGSNDSTTRVWDASNGQQLCRLLSFTDGTWAAMAPDGRFETNNLEEIKGLHWIIPDDPFRPLPLEVFMRDYYEPHLLARLIKCNREKNCNQEFQPVRDISKLNRVQPPVNISNVSTPDAEGYVNVTVEVGKGEGKYLVNGQETTRTTGAYDLRLFRDGQMVGSWPAEGAEKLLQRTAADFDASEKLVGDMRFAKELSDWRGATEVKMNSGMFTLPPFRVKLPRGKDVSQIEFTAYAFNEDRIKSQTARWQWSGAARATLPKAQPVMPRAYIITIGVNAYENPDWNLKYAANDARQIQRTLSEKLAQGKEYQEVVPISLISDYQTKNGQDVVSEKLATKANIRSILDLLAGKTVDPEILKSIPGADKVRKAGPDDLVIISFSSHGYADNHGNFYFVPYDVGPGSKREITSDLLRHCISSEELSLWLRDLDAGEMVIVVDACHSAASVQGEGFKPGPMGSRGLGQLSYDKGIRILTSTQSDDVALETEFTQQGLLSYALMHDGIEAGEADFKPRDKVITLAEWLEYGVDRVPKLYGEIEKKYQTLALNEIKSLGVGPGGRTKLLIFSRDGTNSSFKKGSNQQPSLFDFTRKKRDVVLTRHPPASP